ncbi:hypothetical protein WGM54_14250 [Paenibacillus polymyxa]|uniref:hypothetical protein n=1 Tax=Paenibacillus polymyxa TaxID=1406 RepID=UPI00307D8270
MGIGNESISFLVKIIMDDLNEFLSERELTLTSAVCDSLGTWLEFMHEATDEDREVILNEFHEALGHMNVWEYDQTEQKQIVEKIYQYFTEFYGTEEHVRYFADLFVDYYKAEVKEEFNF